MTILSKLFGSRSIIQNKLAGIELNYCGLPGDAQLKQLVKKKDYWEMKMLSLTLYNKADDMYSDSGSEEDLNLMYIYRKNHMACDMMWFYNDQIIPTFGDTPEDFIVRLSPTAPFVFPESEDYHGHDLKSSEYIVPFVGFYNELASHMSPAESRFVYDIIIGPSEESFNRYTDTD